MQPRRVIARSADATLVVEVLPDGRTTVSGPPPAAGAVSLPAAPIEMITRYDGHGRVNLSVEGRHTRAWAVEAGETRWVFLEGDVFQFEIGERPVARARRAAGGGPESLTAPMPATVVRILVGPGQPVRRGESLVLLEAMKMELPLRAPHDAVVRAIRCTEGELVQPGVALVDLEGA